MILDDLIARLPADACVTVSKIGHRWSAGLRSRAHGSWSFSGAATPGDALRKALADLPGVPERGERPVYSTNRELDEALAKDAAYLEAMGANPGPSLDDLGVNPGRYDEDLTG